MTFEDLQFELTVIENQLAPVLDEEGRRAVIVARADVERQLTDALAKNKPKKKKGKPKKKPLPPWTLDIPPTRPLLFVPTTVGGHRFIVDMFCLITQPDASGVPAAGHNIAVRVWTDDMDLWFRPGVDADVLGQAIIDGAGRRVMLRFHFDYANPRQAGPRHHLQIGGVQHGAEHCWFPSGLDVPRFCHHPVSLVMACEFVIRSFYPATYVNLSQEPTWRRAVARAQLAYLEPYYELQGTTVDPKDLERSYLDRMWN
jgi:hypothetical protein